MLATKEAQSMARSVMPLARYAAVFVVSAALLLVAACDTKDPSLSSLPTVAKTQSSGASVDIAPVLPDPLAPKYKAALDEGWNFSKLGSPDYIASIYGLSVSEPWGRWTDGDVAVLRFTTPLPPRFSIELSGGAFGANIGKPVGVRVGGIERQVIFKGGPFENTATVKAEFVNEAGSDTVTILLPAARPASAGDPRRLGLALISLKIVPAP